MHRLTTGFLVAMTVVVLLAGPAAAGNRAGQAELVKYGFRVIETGDLFMVKYHAPSPAPLLRIERLPARFQLPAGEPTALLRRLEAQRLADPAADEPPQRVKYLQLERAITTQAQAAYKLSFDVNLDGTPDVFIAPYLEHLAFDGAGASIEARRPFGAVQRELMVNMPIRWTWLVTLPGSPLMPVFDRAEFFIESAEPPATAGRRSGSPSSSAATPGVWPSSFALQDYPGQRDPQRLAIRAVSIEPLADGNLVIGFQPANGEPIQVRTHFTWEE